MFVVIEWVDWSWKATQTALCVKNLTEKWYSVDSISCPAYWQWSCVFVEKFLNWELWTFDQINPYLWSSFYSMDRFWQLPNLKNKLENNDFVISDRYSTANFLHRWVKYLEDNDIDGLYKFYDWIYDFEFNKLWLPKPDLILFLSLWIDNVTKLITKKLEQTREYITAENRWLDIAEKDIKHQTKSIEVWRTYLPKYFSNCMVVDCENTDWTIMTPDQINNKILDIILTKWTK